MENIKRSADVLITEVELMNSSAERVYEWLKKRVEKKEEISYSDKLDKFVEIRLLDRNDRVIDLGIALYGVHSESVSQVFKKALVENNQALILACLSNTGIGKVEYSREGIPSVLIEDEEESLKWFSGIGDVELETLFSNPTLDKTFLYVFLQRKEYWNAIDDKKRLDVVYALANNESLLKCKNRAGESPRTYYSYIHIFQSFWKLAESVPITAEWAQALADLYDKLPKQSLGFDNEKSIKRWMIDFPNDDKLDEKYWPNPYEQIRIALYGLSTTDNIKTKEFNKIYFNHSDIAQRISAYKKLRITVDEMDEAFEKDKLLSIGAFLENFYIWRNKDTRNALKEIVSNPEVSKNDFIFERYDYLQELYEKDYPEWFKEEDTVSIDEDELDVNMGRLKENLILLQDFTFSQNADLLAQILRVEKETKKKFKLLLFLTGLILVVILWKIL